MPSKLYQILINNTYLFTWINHRIYQLLLEDFVKL